jgi:hypothetical protein
LLCGMEQARRSALAHHVHRTAPMGPRVLINGIWYKYREGQHFKPSAALRLPPKPAIACTSWATIDPLGESTAKPPPSCQSNST